MTTDSMTDLTEKAREIVARHYSDECIRSMDRKPRMEALKVAISQALAGERERCAKIVAVWLPNHPETSRAIASAIREGSPE